MKTNVMPNEHEFYVLCTYLYMLRFEVKTNEVTLKSFFFVFFSDHDDYIWNCELWEIKDSNNNGTVLANNVEGEDFFLLIYSSTNSNMLYIWCESFNFAR